MSMSMIQRIQALEVLDSRGNPTVAAQVLLSSGHSGYAIAPSGASTGSREALEWRDKEATRYLGKGVLKSIEFIEGEINETLHLKDALDQAQIDACLIALDGTQNKARLGANTILAVSLAVAKAAAAFKQEGLYLSLSTSSCVQLPLPMMNIINGGVHADNSLDIQEFMILPVGAPTFSEALRYGVEVFHHLKNVLHQKKLSTSVGDEGGFAPNLSNNESALECIMEAITKAGFIPGKDIYLGLDVASTELYHEGHYQLMAENKRLTAMEFVHYLKNLVKNYPIITIEDGMAENDWTGWRLLTDALGHSVQLVGDDLFVTNTELLQKGITQHTANAILIKPNQIGTLTETLAAIQMAKEANYNIIVSHRSGETEDTTIADLSVATSAGQIKTGSLCRSDRVAKYNRLLQIEKELGVKARYNGREPFLRFGGVK